jgi:hypothetical protein
VIIQFVPVGRKIKVGRKCRDTFGSLQIVVARNDYLTILQNNLQAGMRITRIKISVMRNAEPGDIPKTYNLITTPLLDLVESKFQANDIFMYVRYNGDFHLNSFFVCDPQIFGNLGILYDIWGVLGGDYQ